MTDRRQTVEAALKRNLRYSARVRKGVVPLTIAAVVLILTALLLGYDFASPAISLNAYAPIPISATLAELAMAVVLYGIGASLLAIASRSMPDDSRDASASVLALLAIAAVPASAVLAYKHYWTEVGFVLLTVVVIVAPMAVGSRRSP